MKHGDKEREKAIATCWCSKHPFSRGKMFWLSLEQKLEHESPSSWVSSVINMRFKKTKKTICLKFLFCSHPSWACTLPGTGLGTSTVDSISLAEPSPGHASVESGILPQSFPQDIQLLYQEERLCSVHPFQNLQKWPADVSGQSRTCYPWLLLPLFLHSLGTLWREC